jgi:hypothetical protein
MFGGNRRLHTEEEDDDDDESSINDDVIFDLFVLINNPLDDLGGFSNNR